MRINGKFVRVYDNKGKSVDNYTVVIGNSVYAMNHFPFHPAFGFCQYCGEVKEGYKWNKNWGRKIYDKSELPEDVVQAIIARFE